MSGRVRSKTKERGDVALAGLERHPSKTMAHTTYDLDLVHSQVGFSVVHLMITRVHGVFSKWSGTFDIDPDDPTNSRVRVQIDAASVDTRNPQRDGHLRSPDFFDAENHPTITFASTGVEKTPTGLRLHGDLTLRGITHPLAFEVTAAGPASDSAGRARLGYRATGRISRKAFGVSWHHVYDGGSVVVADEVDLVLDLQLIPR